MTDYELNVNFDDYCFCEEEGTFKAVLDFARYGKKKNVIAYFTFEDGRKIMACAWNNMSYLGLNRLPIGTELYLTFAKKKVTAVICEMLKSQNNVSHRNEQGTCTASSKFFRVP